MQFIHCARHNKTLPKSTQVLEKKIEDKSIFLDIIKQVQIPSVQVQVRTVEEMEKINSKTYRELMLMCHLPNFKRINPNAKEQTKMMAASCTNRSPA